MGNLPERFSDHRLTELRACVHLVGLADIVRRACVGILSKRLPTRQAQSCFSLPVFENSLPSHIPQVQAFYRWLVSVMFSEAVLMFFKSRLCTIC